MVTQDLIDRAKVPDNGTAMDIMQEVYLNGFTNLDQLQTA